MIVKAKIIKQVFKCDAYQILGAVPCDDNYDDSWDIVLNKYGNFSLKDPTLVLNEGKEYVLELSEAEFRGEKQYIVETVPSMQISSYKDITPEMEQDILKDITTESQAKYIHEAYPDFIKLILAGKEAEIDTNKIYNVGETRLKVYVREINEKYKYYHLMMSNKHYQLDIADCRELCSVLSTLDNANRVLDATPYYSLIKICGYLFDKADKLILAHKPELAKSAQRVEYLILSMLKSVEDSGSTYIDARELAEYINGFDSDMVSIMKQVCLESPEITFDESDSTLARTETYLAECMVADFVTEKIKTSTKLDIDHTKYKEVDGFVMTDTQLQALKNFCDYDISILAGYSGSGKSSSTKGLVALMEDNDLSYTLLSSTGKASRVLSEACGRDAQTIHKKCFEGDILTDVIIVDECSMISLNVFTMLISAIKNPNAKIVLVGDSAQLTAIGLSKIFTDLIDSDVVPKVVLTEIFRYKSNGSLFVATNIRNGKSFFEEEEMVTKTGGDTYTIGDNYKFIETNNVFDCVVSEYAKLIDKGVKASDILCLSPMNVREAGTYRLNNAIQSMFNPSKPNEKVQTRTIKAQDGRSQDIVITFRTGDIVVNKKNDYSITTQAGYKEMLSEPELNEDDADNSTVLNGQIGVVRQVLDTGLIVQFDEEMLYFNKLKLQSLLLGYAISTHSSQGSSADYTISVVCNEHSKMLSKELLYVADTRCRKQHIDIGSAQAFENALKICDTKLRNTKLINLLNKFLTNSK